MSEQLQIHSLSESAHWPYERPYRKHSRAGEVFDISTCKDGVDDLECHKPVLLHALGTVDLNKFEQVAPFGIDEPTFHGEIYDFETGNLFYPGTFWLAGKKRINPIYESIIWEPKG